MAKASKEELGMIEKLSGAITKMQSHSDKRFNKIHVSVAQWQVLLKMKEKKEKDADIIYPGVVFSESGITLNGVSLIQVGSSK